MAVFSLDLTGHVRTWSAGAEQITGYAAQHIVGHHFARLFTAEAAAAGEPAHTLAEAAARGSYQHFGQLVKRDGSVFGAACIVTAVCDSSGKLAGFADEVRDLANEISGEGARARAEIERSQSLLSAVVEASAAAIASCDNQLRVTSWNKAAERIFGHPAREIIGQPIQKLILPELSREQLLKPVRNGEQLRDLQTRGRRKDGSPVTIILSAAPMIGADGLPLGTSVIARDISARENARRKLEETQRWLRDTVNHAPILITATDQHGIYTMAEGKALSAFGIRGPEALVGQSALELMGPDAPWAHATRQALAGATIQATTEVNGHVFEIWKAPQTDERGRITGTLSVNTDVTRRVMIERELEVRLRQQEAIAAIGKSALEGESLERLARRATEQVSRALEAELAGVWIQPPDGGDFAPLAMTGVAAGELTAGELRLAASGSLAAHAVATGMPVIAGELGRDARFKPHPVILRLGFTSAIATAFGPFSGDRSVLAAYARGTAKFSPDDANFIEAAAHILASASASAEARRKLQRREAYFRRIVENISDSVSVVDQHGIIRSMGGAVEHLFGVGGARLCGTASIELVAPAGRPAVRAASKRAFAHVGEVTRVEFPVRARGGEFACEAIMKSVTDLGDEVMLVVSLRDISERKRHEEEIARARDTALESVRLKSAFLANMSHEVRTPVNIIMGYCDLVAAYLAERGDETQAEFLNAIARAGHRLLGTIDAILDYSRLSAKSLEITPRIIRVGPLLERQLEQTKAAAEAKNLTLAYVNEAAGAEVWCDEYCLTRALQHLLDNAIKFTQQGEISVCAYHDHNSALRIDICDTGIGIEPAFLPRLLEPFSQEDSGFNRRFEGSGLGLALAQGYLACNGARLVASSQKGAGSIFTLIFPRRVDCADAAGADQ